MNNPIVDFYENSSAGPTIRIDTQETSSIRVLADLFDRLSSYVGTAVDLSSLEGFKLLSSIQSFVLKSSASVPNRKVIRIAPGIFEWHGTPDDWRDTRDLTIPLLKGRPSHQYLNNGRRDDATVEVAILEQRPVWLQRLVDAETMND